MERQISNDGRGDIMQEGPSQLPIPPDLRLKLKDTEWVDGHPFHRVVLTSNGYVDTLMSAWYNSKAEIVVLRDVLSDVTPIEGDFDWMQHQKFEQQMHIQTERGIFCVCTCRAILRGRPDVVEAVLSKRIGVNQIFQHFHVLPRFRLVDAGAARTKDGLECLWREYAMFGSGIDGRGIECRVREDFRPDFLELHTILADRDTKDSAIAPPLKRCKSQPHPVTANFGNLVLGTGQCKVLEAVSAAEHPLQRALLAAAGNVGRILSSYHLCEVSLHVHSVVQHGDQPNTFDREALISCKGVVVGRARSCVSLEGEKVITQVKNGLSTAPGALFRHFNCIPAFTLMKVLFAESPKPGFGRHYRLSSPGISCEIREEFAQIVLDSFDRVNLDSALLAGIPDLF